MRRTSSIAIFFLLAAGLLVGAGATYAVDRSSADVVADGISVRGIPIGGLTTTQAREKLERQLLRPLNRPVVVRGEDRTYRLTPRQARIGLDLDSTVREALRRSRNGNIIARTARRLTGDRIRVDLPVDIVYDPKAVDRLVRRVAADIDRSAKDADVSIGPSGVSTTPSRPGTKVRTASLKRSIKRRLTSFGGARSVRIRTDVIEPEQTTEGLAERYPAIIIVNRGSFQLRLYKNLQLAKTYKVAVGKAGMDTPAGRYAIQDKQVDPVWHVPQSDWAGDLAGKTIPADDPRNPIEARWMGIYNGAGIHGTEAINSLGTAASHGCVRMSIPDVKELFDQVPVGAPVYIS